MNAHLDDKECSFVLVGQLGNLCVVIADGLFRYDFSVLVCDADMVFFISEVDADYRSVLLVHRSTRS